MFSLKLSKWRECNATDAKKLLSQWEKVANAILRVKLKYMKDVYFSWNEIICNAEDRFSCVRPFLQSKSY